MVNQSKINDPRFWAVWKASGSVGGLNDAKRRVAMREFMQNHSILGTLSKTEIKELTKFEFIKGATTIHEQVKRYYLGIKSDSPDKAAQFLAEVNPILKLGIHDLNDVELLSRILYEYISGFLIRYNDKHYTVHKTQFKEV